MNIDAQLDMFLVNAKALKSIFYILFIIEALTEEEKEKLAKIKKKMKRKVSFFVFVTSDLNFRTYGLNRY